MGERELGQRALAARAQVPLPKLRGGGLSDAEWSRVTACAEDPSEGWLKFVCQAPLGMPELRAQAIAYRREVGDVGFVAVDYIQLMRASGQNREQEVASLSRGLKLLAGEMKTHVIALSQLNRQVESRENRRPVLSDLRESGSLEQDADRVMFVYREGYYDERKPQDRAEVIIAKQRNGACRTVELGFSGQTTSFHDID
jgi:replicative DNA helicase